MLPASVGFIFPEKRSCELITNFDRENRGGPFRAFSLIEPLLVCLLLFQFFCVCVS